MSPFLKRWTILAGLALAIAGLIYVLLGKPATPRFAPGSREFFTNAVRLLEEQETAMAAKYFGPELLAQKHGEVFEKLWDALNAASDKFAVLKEFPVPKLIWSARAPALEIAQAVRILDPTGQGRALPGDAFRRLLEEKEAEGWKLAQCEFRHVGFAPEKKPFRESTFYFSAHLENSRAEERVIMEGDLLVKWDRAEPPAIHEIDASRLQIRLRQGPIPFALALDRDVTPPAGVYFVDPLIVRDLPGQGAEIILAARNEAFRRATNGDWNVTQLCDDDPRLILTAVVADFNGDGADDFLNAKFEGLFLHEGTAAGKFPNPARLVWPAQPRLKYAQVMTCGDIDGDGDLDLFVGQYKVPYDRGNMPFPYFEADDGNPSFLLLNDGKGNFTDATNQRGLGPKRNRRVYSSSLIDLDGDKDLDLLIVSDFAGLDAFENDGRGFFKEATAKWCGETHAFGMAHFFSDFNADGRLDILMIGMNSPTVDRLESMGLARPYDVVDVGMRKAVTHGNRLFFGTPEGVFRETALSRQVAHTGWSWGCAAADFDGDGFPDLYIANGHETRQSVRDYETEFWLHDIYVGNSKENVLLDTYFQEKFGRTRGQGWSYGGYEKNRFFLSQGGTNFNEVAYLFGLALEADSRNVVARDLDGDGKPELIVTTFEVFPKVRQTLKVYQNRLEGKSSTNRNLSGVTGASYRSQWK